ncbi:MAG: hypothetical protein C0425_08470 [Chlorobiaceae bacterium]|nr:hypothetical protein [Chlorobiaceae bacterium]
MNFFNLLKIITIKFLLIIFFSSQLFAAEIDSLSEQSSEDTTQFIMGKSPVTALLLSAALPGAGQIYNESYWKAPVVWGISGWFIYNYIQNNNYYKEYRELFITTGLENNRRIREFYRDQRDLFAIYLGLTYFLNLLDAYVDAHLFDFNVTEDFFTKTPMFNIKIKLK